MKSSLPTFGSIIVFLIEGCNGCGRTGATKPRQRAGRRPTANRQETPVSASRREMDKMSITARRALAIHRGSLRRSQNCNGLGVSELFLAPPAHAAVILTVRDLRLLRYLLGFSEIPRRPNGPR